MLVQMCDVGLLVFDEAHHCKSDHPYNQLLQDFYHTLPPQQRPQVGRRVSDLLSMCAG
jgi:endoribonuclease Dicer